ncbi:MAG: OsmC family protein [bacterium]
MEVSVDWSKNLLFIGKSQKGTVLMDADSNVGGDELAPTPMEMVLFALAGCTGMDVISILKKMKQNVIDMKINIKAEKKDEHPKVFTKIDIIFNIQGKELDKEKIEHAIYLSKTKYCPVQAMLSKTAEIKNTINIEENPE